MQQGTEGKTIVPAATEIRDINSLSNISHTTHTYNTVYYSQVRLQHKTDQQIRRKDKKLGCHQ